MLSTGPQCTTAGGAIFRLELAKGGSLTGFPTESSILQYQPLCLCDISPFPTRMLVPQFVPQFQK